MNSHDLTLIIVAVIAAVPTLLALGYKEHRDKARQEALHDEVRTNHGMRLGEHIENIEEKQDWITDLMLIHTAQDDARFQQLNLRLDAAGIPRAGDDR